MDRHVFRSIVTAHEYPPIPIRQFDWRAWIDGYEESYPTGWASTEIGAIEDLRQQLLEGGYKLYLDED